MAPGPSCCGSLAELSVEDGWPGTRNQARELQEIDATQTIGQQWLVSGRSCVLRVPSIVVPEEQNLVLNPQHSQASRLQLVAERSLASDGRLL
jgi:RES domain-containing protein